MPRLILSQGVPPIPMIMVPGWVGSEFMSWIMFSMLPLWEIGKLGGKMCRACAIALESVS